MTRKVDYFPKWVLGLAAIVVSHHVVAGTQDKDTLQIMVQLNYYVAMVFSWPLTYLLMWWVHFCIKRLDVMVPWQAYWARRFFLQFVLCVLLVIMVDLSVVRLYFWAFDNDFSASGYMRTELLIILWMVLFMNAVYTAWYFSLNYVHGLRVNVGLRERLEQIELQQGASSLRIDARLGNKVLQVSLDEIACFERHENIGHVHLKTGRVYYVELTMPSLLDMLAGEGFYQINRSVLISLSVVKGYEKVKNMQARVILVDGVLLEVSLMVSRSRLNGFRQALGETL